MTNRTTTPDTPEEREAFKRKVIAELHEYGDEEGWCDAYDEILLDLGLPSRPDHLGFRPDTEIVGEDTDEAFQAWRVKLSAGLHQASHRSGYSAGHFDDDLVRMGLLRWEDSHRTMTVRIKGEFSILLPDLEVPMGSNLIDVLPEHRVSRIVTLHWHTEAVTWKATTVEEPTDDAA